MRSHLNHLDFSVRSSGMKFGFHFGIYSYDVHSLRSTFCSRIMSKIPIECQVLLLDCPLVVISLEDI